MWTALMSNNTLLTKKWCALVCTIQDKYVFDGMIYHYVNELNCFVFVSWWDIRSGVSPLTLKRHGGIPCVKDVL